MRKLWNWYDHKASIRTKLMISYLLLVLLPTLSLGIYIYREARENLLAQVRSTAENNAAVVTGAIAGSVQHENDNIKYLAYNKKFREKLGNGSSDVIGLAQELNENVEPTLWYFITSDSLLKSVTIYARDLEGKVGNFVQAGADYPGSWEAEENTATRWYSSKDLVFAARPILDAATSSKIIGMMELQVYAAELFSSIDQTAYLGNAIAVFDGDGKLIYGNSEAKERSDQFSGILAQQEGGYGETQDHICVRSGIAGTDWTLLYLIDRSRMESGLAQIGLRTVEMCLACLGAALVVICLIANLLTRRIMNLKRCAEQVGNGTSALAIPEDATDEIAVVEKSFLQMSRRIDEMMQETYRLGLEKRAEELKVLQAKINPHFLYNCLSSIMWKAIRKDQEDIAEITGLVAKFYRMTLNGGREITTVAQELENIRAYAQIQLRTHDGSFDVRYGLDEAGQDCRMPNFLLQPLVENAIVHGVDVLEEGERGTVTITYEHRGSYLVFSVQNNTNHADEADLQGGFARKDHGYGLYNVRERIRMYYRDPACGIAARVIEPGKVCFQIILSETMDAGEDLSGG